MSVEYPGEVEGWLDEGRQLGRDLLRLERREQIEAFARAYAAVAESGGAKVQECPAAGLERLFVFPDLTWREARLLDSTLSRTLLLRLSDGMTWGVQIPAAFAVSADLLQPLAKSLKRAPADVHKWGPLSTRLSGDLVRLQVVNLPLDDLDSPPWELEKATRALCHAAVGKAVRWYEAKNLTAVRERFKLVVRAQLHGRFERFLRTGCPAMQSMPGALRPLTINRFNYVRNCPADVARNRLQVSLRYPLLLPMLAGEARHASPRLRGALHAIVDQGRPFVKEVAALIEVKPEVVRQLRLLDPHMTGARWLNEPDVLLRLLGALPPEKRPTTLEAWRQFNRAVSGFQTMLGDIRSPALLAYWLRDAAEVGLHGTPQGALALLAQPNAARSIADFLAALREGLIAAIERESGNRSKRMRPRFGFALVVDEILFGVLRRISVRLLLEYAGRWHDHYRTLQEETALPAGVPAVQQWEALAPALRVGELRVVGLVSEGDLLEEGRAMQHCVGSYVHRCWAYRSFVFSVRDATGRSLSTFELALRDPSTCRDADDPHLVRMVQHFGPANGQPSAQCNSAAEVFVEHVERTVPVARIRALLDKGRLRGEVLKSPRHSAQHAWILGESLRRSLRPRLAFDALIEQIVAAADRLARSSSDGA